LKLTIAKLQRRTFGASSESGKKLLDRLELQLAKLEESLAEDKASEEMQAPSTTVTDDAIPKARSPPAAWASAASARV